MLTLALVACIACAFEDCNGNGIDDAADIFNGTSLDLNGDGIPDECQFLCSDCDGNGLPDDEEQAALGGLAAQYFISAQGAGNFTERVLARIDDAIDFDWGDAAPDPSLPTNDFSVRWTGVIVPPTTGTYTVFTTTDDGVRLWIDGQILIDRWNPQSATTWSATVELVAGVPHLIRMDYYEAGGQASARLEWQGPGIAREIVPSSALRPLADADGDGYPDACADCNGNGIVDAAELAQGLAEDCNGNCVPDSCEATPSRPLAYWRFEESATAIVDDGPSGLTGVATGAALSSAVPVAAVPATNETNANALALGGDGHVVVQDPTGVLAFGGESFTVEAWVRLDELADSAAAGERQVLVQRKPLNASDGQADFIVFVQGGNMPTASAANFGKSAFLSGRELVVAFGKGTGSPAFWSVTSTFEIEDSGWHFVTVSFDALASEVRFGLDGALETVPVVDQGHVAVAAPVVIGAHTGSNGGFNQFLRGSVDEVRVSAGVVSVPLLLNRVGGGDCNGNGIPDGCDIAQGASEDCDADGLPDECEADCNGNGVPDGCDILFGTSGDCNGNGVPDECELTGNDCDGNGIPDDCDVLANDCNGNGIPDACDIAAGLVEDCQNDGVPDSCQLGAPTLYSIDDGSAEFGVRAEGTFMAWLTQYRVEGGAGVIEAVDMMFVFTPVDQPVGVYLWSDPNGDGDPTDAQVLSFTIVTPGELGVVRTIDIPDVEVGPNGTSFFVGAITTTTGADFPGPLDTSGNPLFDRSWIVGSDAPINPNNLSAGALEFKPIEDALPFPGKWVLRARGSVLVNDCNGNGVPDDCDIASGTSADVDGTGVPDECEDCNGNGVLDSIDIAFGTSADCQVDGIPDECQLPGGDCDGNGVPDACQLAGADCNGNGILDSCDLAAGTSLDIDGSGIPDECEDCNGNGVLDSFDIKVGTSEDCQPDGIPDECQFGVPLFTVEYLHDDGTRDGNYGVGGQADIVWMNAFSVEPGGETIGRIDVVLGNAFAGVPYKVGLWSDPDGNGEPDDAQLIAVADAIAANGNSDIFNEIPIAPTTIGPAGTSFFAGVIYRDDFGNQFPIAADLSAPDQRSWVAAGPTVDPNDLSAAPLYGFFLVADVMVRARGFDGVLPDDCNGNGVPDSCDIEQGTGSDFNGNGVLDQCEGCAADLSADGAVGPADLALLLGAWGTEGPGDLNVDGVVGSADLAILLGSWGPCP